MTCVRGKAVAFVLAALIAGFSSDVAAQGKGLAGFGVVLLHGKGGAPGGNIAPMAAALQSEGAIVIMPRMAWTGSKGQPDKYGVPYEQALTAIDGVIAQLKRRGAKRIVVAGQSLGANAAIGYAARHGDGLAAVIALAPGHAPERMRRRPDIAESATSAKQLVAAGKGNVLATFSDINQEPFKVKATPAAYLSFFDPDGPAVIPRNAAAMPAIPFLWVIGRSDPLAQAGSNYAFDKAAKHAKSKYVEVNAGHLDTPAAARTEVIAWLKSL
jgi:pimeloyl-ACP methyl ester carboxylesterase